MKAFQLVKFMKKVLANREVSIYVHGKGEFTSPKAFLKSHVFSWMKQSELVLAAHSAMPYHGGAGALYVLLKKNDEMKSDNRQKYF